MRRLGTKAKHDGFVWNLLVVVLVATMAVASVALAAENEDEERNAPIDQIIAAAKISLGDAVAYALQAHPGRAVEAELEGEISDSGTDIFYEVKIVDASGSFYELKLDPADGRVLADTLEDESEDAAEQQELQQALAGAKIDLATCISAAASENKGRVFAATMEMDDGSPICEAATTGKRHQYEIEIDLVDGKVAEIDRATYDDDRDEDDDHHGDRGQDEDDD